MAQLDQDQLRAWSAGLDIPVGAFGLGFIGWAIDRWQGTAPWWMLGLGLAGVIGGCYRFVREAMRMNRAQVERYNRTHGRRGGSASGGSGRAGGGGGGGVGSPGFSLRRCKLTPR